MIPLSGNGSLVGEPVVRPMPRRRQVQTEITRPFGPPPLGRAGIPKPSLIASVARLLVWIRAILSFFGATYWDVLRGRDSQERRAVRLRETIQDAGGTLIKIGQQLSIRTDMLPVRYCYELTKMLDRVPPIPTAQAIATIERSTGRSLGAIFSQFDPDPIGSASIACVYQAVLRSNGELVAVKVRRPGIEKVFAADFRVLDWLMSLAEMLTVLRPGFTGNFRRDFRSMLGAELDFRREARLQEIFRRNARKAKDRCFTAQRVYFEYTNDEVIVQEFAAGIWLFEVLAAVEHHDPAAIARMQELNVDAQVVARRLMYASYWGLHENLFFHADPHPANIVVRRDSELIFIDFGACGFLDHARQLLFRRGYEAQARGDIWAMVQASLAISEPLPPVDVNAVAREMEVAAYNHQIAFKSRHAEWWERTSAAVWTVLIQVIRKYNIPAPIDMLLFSRATLLYDTLAVRLDPTLDVYKEYRRWAKDARRKARKRTVAGLRRRLRSGPTDSDFAVFEHVGNVLGEGLYRLERWFSTPHEFLQLPYTIEKSFFTFLTMIRFVIRAGLLAVVLVAGTLALHAAAGQSVGMWETLKGVLRNPSFLAAVAVLAAIHLRLIMFRMADRRPGF